MHERVTKSRLLRSGALAAMILAGAPALAQPSDSTSAAAAPRVGVDEIVVTARRREENLQDVPVSIVAFNQNSLTENAVASAADLGRVTPGLIAVAGSGNPNLVDFSIRGRGLNFGAAAGSVETYFAEVPLSPNFQMPQLPPQFFDVASVQVLKGPQGTLFGRSTTGGAVLIQPALPTDIWEGYGRIQLGNYNHVQVEGALNIPVIEDVLAIRLAGLHWKRDGYMKLSQTLPDSVTSRFSDPAYLTRLFGRGTTFTNGRVIGSNGRTYVDNGVIIAGSTGLPIEPTDYNNKDATDLRATIRFTPGDRFENNTIVTFHRDRNLGSTSGGLLVIRNAQGAPIGTEPSPGSGGYTGYLSTPPQRGESRSYAIVNTTKFDVTNDISLRNIFGYIQADGFVLDAFDPDGTVARTIDTYLARRKKHVKQYTNELQLQGVALDDRLEFTFGGLVDLIREPRNPNRLNTASVSGNGTTARDPAHPNAQAFLTRYLSSNIDSHAVYGSLTYKLTDALSVTGGYRHTWDKVDAIQAVSLSLSTFVDEVFQDANADVAGFQQTRRLRDKFQSDVYNASIDYQVTQDILLYAGYRHGFKRGGFNSSAFGSYPPSFGPEKIDSFSVGAKTEFDLGAATRARFNIEGFYDKYKGFQASYLLLDPATFNLLTLTANIPKVRYTGFDSDLTLSFGDWLDLSASYAYLDAKIQSFPDTTTGTVVAPSLEDNEITYASKHQLQASARFHGRDDAIGEWVLRPSVSYRSKFYTTLFNRMLPASQRAAFGTFDNIALGGGTVPGLTLVDLRAELNEVAGSNFSFAVGATNLFDKYYRLGNSGTLSFGIQGDSAGPPRMVYGEISYRF